MCTNLCKLVGSRLSTSWKCCRPKCPLTASKFSPKPPNEEHPLAEGSQLARASDKPPSTNEPKRIMSKSCPYKRHFRPIHHIARNRLLVNEWVTEEITSPICQSQALQAQFGCAAPAARSDGINRQRGKRWRVGADV